MGSNCIVHVNFLCRWNIYYHLSLKYLLTFPLICHVPKQEILGVQLQRPSQTCHLLSRNITAVPLLTSLAWRGFINIVYSFIHMCIHCLGYFSPLCPSPSLSPPPSLTSRKNLFCPYLINILENYSQENILSKHFLNFYL
jgi:hypothetical protein